MCNQLKNNGLYLLFILSTVIALSACGGSSSSSNDTVPSTATIFYAHNLVFRNSTTLLSTGYNGFGQLGTGNLDSRKVLGTLKYSYPFSGTATGGDHSVAFFNNSTVRSWGYNKYGQLGNASTTYSSTPVKVAALSGVKAVAAGAYHTLALTGNGTLWAWGYNGYGQLGYPTAIVQDNKVSDLLYSTAAKPVVVAATGAVLTNISAIAANGYNSLALQNGNVLAWGNNQNGQLGTDPSVINNTSSQLPLLVAGLPSSAVSAIAVGGAFNYAVANGEVWAWGANDNGQLGNGLKIDDRNFTVPDVAGCSKEKNYCFIPFRVVKADLTPLTDIVQVAAGIQHGLARDSQGRVWAWGYNSYSQLGSNNPLDSPYAVQVLRDTATPPTQMSGATDIRAFGSSSMAKIGGVWYAWGDNYYGQLGIGTSGSNNATVNNPVKMTGF